MQDRRTLPVDVHLAEVCGALATHGSGVLTASPGAGKTTRVPPAVLLQARGLGQAPAHKVIMLQPRRMAARAAAARIAWEQGWTLGREVGYQVRFDNRTTRETRLVIMTEGTLTRRLQGDPFLEDVFCVILDEFHERSIHTDVALAMLQEIRSTVRPDLKVLIMSATLQSDAISTYLGHAPAIDVQGRTFPVEIVHAAEGGTKAKIAETVAGAARDVLREPPASTGHILVFLPGIGEIRKVSDLIVPAPGDSMHILHSSVSAQKQDAALAPASGRKVILATNIAETSLTIDGVRTVIDSGYERVPLQDSRLGIDRLELRRISLASATQRAGRAGRTSPGKCLRLWSHAEHAALEEQGLPEILRTDLAPTVLALKAYGVTDPAKFGWFQAPRAADLQRASNLLWMLGAIDREGRLTPEGKRLAAVPAHPRIARLLLAGAELGILHDMAMLGARLSDGATGRHRSPHGTNRTTTGSSDLLEWLEPEPDPALRQRLGTIQQQLLQAVERGQPVRRSGHSCETLLRQCIFMAYPDRLTLRRTQDASRGVMVGNRGVVIDATSIVRDAPLFVSLDPTDLSPSIRSTGYRDGIKADESRVSICSAVEEEWLDQFFPHLVEEQNEAEYDPARDRVLVLARKRFAGLLIRERITGGAVQTQGAEENPLLQYLLSDDQRLLRFLEGRPESYGWLSRLQFLAAALPQLHAPAELRPWLSTALHQAVVGHNSLAGVQDQELLRALKNSGGHTIKEAVDKEAPCTFTAPSGSAIRLEYPELQLDRGSSESPQPPTASVRLQELFGLVQSPRVAAGRVAVVLHLLSPGYRPVQVTTDLHSFWQNTYAEVRRELRGRYPKHPWPENPMDAPPVAIGRRRK